MTIKDIARLANVSTATVSRILNNSKKVKPETRKRVMQIIQDNNYHPNQVARSLYKKKSKMIGVIVPDLSNAFYAKIIDGIQGVLQKNGYSILISFSAGSNADNYRKFINEFKQQNIDGIISSAFLSSTKINLPLVMYDSANIKDKVIRIASNNTKGGQECANLLKKKVKSVIIQHLSLGLPTVRERISAITGAFNKRKINYQLIDINEYNIAEAAKSTLDSLNQHDAIIAVNDIYAAAIIKEARNRSLAIPTDFELVGYDNNDLAEYTDPTISTIDQQPYLIGKTAAKRLIALLKGNKSINNSIIDVKTIKRQTTL
ncbi:MAG: LacI family DNA-binding transcriptional regulator [Lactobacillus crispatus]